MLDINLRMFYGNPVWVSYILLLSTFWCGLSVSVCLLICSFVYYETFCYQVSGHFFFSLCMYLVLILSFYCLYNGRVQVGQGRVWSPRLICRGKKNRRERLKGRISNKKPLKADIKFEKFLF